MGATAVSAVVAYPAGIIDHVTAQAEYAERRHAADAAFAVYQDQLQAMGLLGDPSAVHDAWHAFVAAQAHVTELYDAAFTAHREGRL